MEIPGKVTFYCPLLDAKGTPATLMSVLPHGYYQLEVQLKGRRHVVLAPIAQTAVVFADPEPEPDENLELER